MSESPWTKERVEQLRELWDRGLSQNQCAALLGEGISRNSVAGKIDRLGLKRDVVQVIRPPKPAKVEKPKKLVKQHKLIGSKQYVERPQPVVCGLPVTGRVQLVDLKYDDCRFPIGNPGDENFAFCGDQRIAGKPYCAAHSNLCLIPPPKKKPNLYREHIRHD
jgi:GcrA cell cycle regulator